MRWNRIKNPFGSSPYQDCVEIVSKPPEEATFRRLCLEERVEHGGPPSLKVDFPLESTLQQMCFRPRHAVSKEVMGARSRSADGNDTLCALATAMTRLRSDSENVAGLSPSANKIVTG
jgi:hypothetical protein